MLSFNNNFLGYHPKHHNEAFSGSDNEELYHKNLKLQPDDWYYRTHSLSYVRNSNGHRCKEISDIDLNNYILFIGCSHTEGIGLELENTYSYLLSKKLGCDYYNLALGGTGIDVINYNIVTWFSKIKQPPKLLIVQWPSRIRATLYHSDEWHTYGMWPTKNYKLENEIYNFFISGEDIGFFETTKILTRKTIYNIATCPIIEASTAYSTSHDNDEEYLFKRIDNSRDITNGAGHMGIKSDLVTSIMLYQKAVKLINT
jgi:hypothetical protein